MNLSVPIISVLVGAAVLLFGRKLFWLFVAALGFAVGLEIAAYFMKEPPTWLTLAVALGCGVVGALLLLALFDWVLIFLSSVEGAHLITNGIVLPEKGELVLFIALAITGVIVQGSMLRRSRSTAD